MGSAFSGAKAVVRTYVDRLRLLEPFHIFGHIFHEIEVVRVAVEADGVTGWGECIPIYYRADTAVSIARQIKQIPLPPLSRGTRTWLMRQVPASSARNGLDCALWDWEAKAFGTPAYVIARLRRPEALLTTFTCGAAPPAEMAAKALSFPNARAIKAKLAGDGDDASRVRAIRDAMPDVWLGVDANQGLNRTTFEQLLPVLEQQGVSLVEQPFAAGSEELLDNLGSSIPIAADESVQGIADLDALVGRVQIINIKLDKCGGLTEGLEMAMAAERLGFGLMVGNMMGSSLAMAPAFLLGQLCSVVDLDGPILLERDRDPGVIYRDGYIDCPQEIWGGQPPPGAEENRRA